MTDLILAIVHHILVFGLVAMMIATRVLLSGPGVDVMRLARADAGAGALSGLVLAVGIARVVWGGKGWEFYQANPFFWAKIGLFMLIGLLTVPGTMAFLKWRKALAADPSFTPDPAEVARLRGLTGVQALVLAILLACAAAMARYPF
jgi:putative membrane protein